MNNNKKFDGPSFLNPNHTSHGLGNNIYQHPTYIPSANQAKIEETKKTGNKKGPKGKYIRKLKFIINHFSYFEIFFKFISKNRKIIFIYL